MELWINNVLNVNRQNHCLNSMYILRWPMVILISVKFVREMMLAKEQFQESVGYVVKASLLGQQKLKEGAVLRVLENVTINGYLFYLRKKIKIKLCPTKVSINGLKEKLANLAIVRNVNVQMAYLIGQIFLENIKRILKIGNVFAENVILTLTLFLTTKVINSVSQC